MPSSSSSWDKYVATFEAEHGPSSVVRDFAQYMDKSGLSSNVVLSGGGGRKKYNIILADPPWPYTSRRMVQDNGNSAAGISDEYSTMSIQEMMDLPIQNVCAPNCVLYMWTTGPKLEEAFRLINAWGFKYSTVAYVWEKRIPNPGFYSMSSCEYVLVAKRGRAPERNNSVNTRQFLQETRTVHSKKPEAIQDMIEAQFRQKGVNKLELFARRFRKGWDCQGNELNGSVQDFLAGKKTKLRQ